MTDDPPAQRPTDPYRRQPPTIDLQPASGGAGSRPAGSGPAPASGTPTSPAPAAAAGPAGKAPVGAVPPPSSQTARAASPGTGGAVPKMGAATGPSAGTTGRTSVPPVVKTSGANAAKPAAPSPEAPRAKAPIPEPIPNPQPATGAAAAPRRGAGGILAAGLTGGIVGAAFAVGADLYWRQPPADFESRLAALETRPAPTPPASANGAVSGLDRRVAALEGQTKSLADSIEAARVAASAAAAGAGAATVQPTPDPGLKDAVAGLDGRLAKLEGTAGAGATQESVNALGSRIQDLQTQTEERARQNAAAIGSLQGTAGSLGERLAADAKSIEAIRADLGRLPPALLTPALRAVAAAQASAALDDGAPLGPAIAALERLGVGGDALAPLRPYAEKPPPSPAALLAEFRPLGDRLTALPQGASDSFTDRLKRIAEKVVTVRAVGDGSGDDVPGLVGRIEAALGRGATADAAAAWDRLPEPSRRETAEWGAGLKARVAAAQALRRLNADSLAALAAPAR